MSAMMYLGFNPEFAYRLFIVSVDVEAPPLADPRFGQIHAHARLERDAQIAIVLHVRLVEDQIRIPSRALGARMRVVPIGAFRVHHLLHIGRVAGVVHLAVHRIDLA